MPVRGLLSDPTLPIPTRMPTWGDVRSAVMGLLTPPDPYAEAGKAVEEYRAGQPLDALATMYGAMPATGTLVPAHAKKAAAAQEMLAKGAPAKDIHKKTGLVQGSDKVWLDDIPDDEFRLKPDAQDQLLEHGKFLGLLSDAVDHGRLFEAVPGLLQTKANLYLGPSFEYIPGVKPVPGKRGFAATYDKGSDAILAQADTIDRIGPWSGDASGLNLMDSLIHEGTHAVQQKTGTPNGGSSGHFQSNVLNGILAPYASEYQRTGAIQKVSPDEAPLARMVVNKTGKTPFEQSVKQVAKQPEDVLRYLMTAFDRQTPNGQFREPFDAYYRLQGEANARLGEMRRKVGPTLRRYVSPVETLETTAGQPKWGELFPAYGPWWQGLDLGK